MNLPLKRKVEKAIATDFLPKHLNADGVKIYEGHDPKDEAEFPYIVVYASDSQLHSDMPGETGVRVVDVQIQFNVDSTENARAALDTWKEQVECAMLNREKIQAALNAPASGPDRRKVGRIHFHDVVIGSDPSAREATNWIEDLNFSAVVESS